MAARKKSEPTYTEAATELERILDEIESGDADVDVLGEKVERAATLIRHCREKLSGTEMRVRKVVADLQKLDADDDVDDVDDEAEADTGDDDGGDGDDGAPQ